MEGEFILNGREDTNAVSSIGNDSFWTNFNLVVNNYIDNVTLEEIVEKNKEFNGFDYCI